MPRSEGEFGYFGLYDWWISTFSAEEREYIVRCHQPLTTSPTAATLTTGHILSTTQTPAGFLQCLASWFNKPSDSDIGLRMLQKAEALAFKNGNVLDLHFTYLEFIKINYRMREEDPSFLLATIDACRKQIALAPKAALAFKAEPWLKQLPEHTGFKQLSIILTKQGSYQEALGLCIEAQKQDWAGTWDSRIKRLESSLGKSKKP
jgi:hypothetical protein